MDTRIPPLKIKILLESNPPKSRASVRRSAAIFPETVVEASVALFIPETQKETKRNKASVRSPVGEKVPVNSTRDERGAAQALPEFRDLGGATANLCIKILDFRGFYLSLILT